MSIKISIKNIDQFKKFMEEKQEKTKEAISQSVRYATLELQNQVKISIAQGTNAPVAVDTGRFLNSVDFEPIDSNSAKVFTDIEYAKFIEYGTSKMQSRPHFRNTAMVVHDGIKEIFKNEIKKI